MVGGADREPRARRSLDHWTAGFRFTFVPSFVSGVVVWLCKRLRKCWSGIEICRVTVAVPNLLGKKREVAEVP